MTQKVCLQDLLYVPTYAVSLSSKVSHTCCSSSFPKPQLHARIPPISTNYLTYLTPSSQSYPKARGKDKMDPTQSPSAPLIPCVWRNETQLERGKQSWLKQPKPARYFPPSPPPPPVRHSGAQALRHSGAQALRSGTQSDKPILLTLFISES
jgi:hypothetical protein